MYYISHDENVLYQPMQDNEMYMYYISHDDEMCLYQP